MIHYEKSISAYTDMQNVIENEIFYICKLNYWTFYVIHTPKNTSLKKAKIGGRNM